MPQDTRYNRQTLLPQIGQAGQDRLRTGRVLLVGCGALGTQTAEQLARAGVGFLRIADRDIVELSNLQRQTLFDESHARDATPKALAAAQRLAAVNSDVLVEPHVVDVDSESIRALVDGVHLVIDGTDNVVTRYLINDIAIQNGIPWVYGACVGVEGRVMPVLPSNGPCLRCVFETPPAPGELTTCDTVGVLGSAAAMVASMQTVAAIRILIGDPPELKLTTLNAWAGRVTQVDVSDGRRADCPCCARRDFVYLNNPPAVGASLCGRDAVQIRGARNQQVDLSKLFDRLSRVGEVRRSEYLLRAQLKENNRKLTVFPDGRAIIHGTTDLTAARAIYDRYVGS